MPPQYPANPAPTPSQNQFDFILNPEKSKRSLFAGQTFGKKIIIIGSVGVVLILLIVILSSVLFKTVNLSTIFTPVAQQQNGMISITTTDGSYAVQQTTKNLGADIASVLTSDQYQLVTFLQQHGTKLNQKVVAAPPSATVTQQLQNAYQASNFDPVYIQTMQSDLKSYISSLQQSFKLTPKSATYNPVRQMLDTEYQHAESLLTEANNAAGSLTGN